MQLHGILFQEIHRSAIATLPHRVKVCKSRDKLHNWLFSLFMKNSDLLFPLLTFILSEEVCCASISSMAPCCGPFPTLLWVKLCVCAGISALIQKGRKKCHLVFFFILYLKLWPYLKLDTGLYGTHDYLNPCAITSPDSKAIWACK